MATSLTPEELRLKRSQAAKKAAETLKKREAEDAEFHERMQAIRLANLARGRAKQKVLNDAKKTDSSRTPKTLRETPKKKYKGHEDTTRKPKIEPPQIDEPIIDIEEEPKDENDTDETFPTKTEEPEIPETLDSLSYEDFTEEDFYEDEREEPIFDAEGYADAREEYGDEANIRDYLPTQTDLIIDVLEAILNASINPSTADFLLQLMNDCIDETDGETAEEQRTNFAKMIASSSDALIDAATAVAYEPSDQENLYHNAYDMAQLLTAGSMTFGLGTGLEEAVVTDIPYNNKRHTI